MTRRIPLIHGLLTGLACLLFATLLTATGPIPVRAAEDGGHTLPGAKGPVTITSEEMSYSRKNGRIRFSGQVRVVQEGYVLTARKVVVILAGTPKKGRQDIRRMVAEEDVRLTYGDRVATAGRAEYDTVAQTVVLTGTPRLSDPKMEVVGKRITIDMATQESTVQGGQFTFRESP